MSLPPYNTLAGKLVNTLTTVKTKWNTISTRVEKYGMKAININHVIYADKKGTSIETRKKSELKKVHAVILTFRHQNIHKTGNN